MDKLSWAVGLILLGAVACFGPAGVTPVPFTGADGGQATCSDGIKNGNETDVDCGGGTCPGCAPGKACLVGTDCASGTCLLNGTCQ